MLSGDAAGPAAPIWVLEGKRGNTLVLLLCQISFPLLSPLPLLILEISLKTGMGLSLSICAWPSHLVLSVCRNRGQIAKIAYGFPPSVVGFGFPNLF